MCVPFDTAALLLGICSQNCALLICKRGVYQDFIAVVLILAKTGSLVFSKGMTTPWGTQMMEHLLKRSDLKKKRERENLKDVFISTESGEE